MGGPFNEGEGVDWGSGNIIDSWRLLLYTHMKYLRCSTCRAKNVRLLTHFRWDNVYYYIRTLNDHITCRKRFSLSGKSVCSPRPHLACWQQNADEVYWGGGGHNLKGDEATCAG